MTWDILIRLGTVIDGSGSPGTSSDIAIADGCIAALGPFLAGDAKKVIVADGLTVTPGFIDIKTHSDFVLPINPKAESKVRQGVTTEIVGHCGFSVAPDGDGCQLTLTHSGLSARDGRGAGVRAGWHAVLEGLADCLDGRATPWAPKEQREAAAAPLYPPLPA